MPNICINKNNQSVVMNAPCVGTLQKTHLKSKFKRFHVHSPMARWVFSDIPHLDETESNNREGKYDRASGKYMEISPEIVVLQLMCFGDNELIIEYVERKDWEVCQE